MAIHPQNELVVIRAVESGELEIDQEGRVWRLKKRTFDRWTGGTRTTVCRRVRAESGAPGGYLQVRVMIDGKRYYAAAHRLVYLKFKGPIPQGMTVNHDDGVKDRNHPENLLLATYSEQRIHAIKKLGARHWDCRGDNHPKAQTTSDGVTDMRRRRALGDQVKAIAADHEMTPKAVSAICTRRTWPHIGG
jgi:hypothetical protein